MMFGNGLFGKIEAALSVDRYHPKDPKLAKLFGLGQSTNAGVRIDHEKTLAIPAIHRGLNIVANSLARAPFYVYKREDRKTDKREIAPYHTSWRAVAVKPCREIKMFDFRRTMTMWAMAWGNAVAFIDRPNWPNGGEINMIPLLPDRTYPVRITRDMVKRYNIDENLVGKLYYSTTINDEEVSYEADSCLHIRGLGSNPYWGIDVVEALREAIGGSVARTEFGHRYYGQGTNPSGFISLPGSLGEENEERFIESLRNMTSGMDKAHRLAVLEEGAQFTQWTVDPEKSQFLEGLELDYRILANVIGIKVHKLIDSANSAYASLESANAEHRDDDIFPWIYQWKSEMQDKLLTENQKNNETHEIDLDDQYIDGWVPYRERIAGVVEAHNNNLLTRDEARRALNYQPSTDSHGEKHVMPMNLTFTEDAAEMADIERTAALNPPAPALPAPAPEDDTEEPKDDNTEEKVLAWTHSVHNGDLGLVLLDGVAVDRAVSCNVVTGVVEVLGIDEDGEPRKDYLQGENVVFVPRDVAEKFSQTDSDKKADALTKAWIRKIRDRLGKQALKVSSKGVIEFGAWVSRLSTESAPSEIQSEVDELYKSVIETFSALVEQGICTDDNLSEHVESILTIWKENDE